MSEKKEKINRDMICWSREIRDAIASKGGTKKIKRRIRSADDGDKVRRRLGQKLEEIKLSKRGKLTKILQSAGMSVTERKRYALFPQERCDSKPTMKINKGLA